MAEHQTEQTEQVALTLVQAAAQLGITPDALRMRYKRGKVRGFKRGGRVFIELDTEPNNRTNQTEQTEQPPEQVNGQDVSQAFDFVVAENIRLNERLDRLMGMLEREQVLRQQQIEQLTDRPALVAPEGQGSDVARRLDDTEQEFGILKRAVVQLVAFLEGGKR
jgi:hypothetical protein